MDTAIKQTPSAKTQGSQGGAHWEFTFPIPLYLSFTETRPASLSKPKSLGINELIRSHGLTFAGKAPCFLSCWRCCCPLLLLSACSGSHQERRRYLSLFWPLALKLIAGFLKCSVCVVSNSTFSQRHKAVI